jgi:hypothetical protein
MLPLKQNNKNSKFEKTPLIKYDIQARENTIMNLPPAFEILPTNY